MIPFPEKKYQVIYADPPWSYLDGAPTRWAAASRYYPTMTLDAIKALPVERISDQDCYLFLWVTFPLLPQALEVFQAWGFQYKTVGFVWVKTTKHGRLFWGLGNRTRSNSELCLMGIRGRPPRVSRSVHSVVMSPVREHSRKPDEVRQRIVQLAGDVPRIELFAREKPSGWDVWGLEV